METLTRATVLGSVEHAEQNRRLADLLVTPNVQDVAMRELWRSTGLQTRVVRRCTPRSTQVVPS